MQIISAILEETINQSKLDITKGVIRHNSKEDFVFSRVARNNGVFLSYLESNPIGNQGASNILIYLNAAPSAVSQYEQMYQAYASAYLQFETVNAQDIISPCIGFEKEFPMYAYEDILEKNVLNSIEGQQLFWQYVNSYLNILGIHNII